MCSIFGRYLFYIILSIHVNLILHDDKKDGWNRLITLLVIKGCSSTGALFVQVFRQ